MRCLVGFVFVLALVASPLSASAQADEEGTPTEPSAEEAVPMSEPASEEPVPPSQSAPEEPALKLKLDDAGVEVAPGSAWANEEYRREELERRARRTRNALIGTSAASVVGWSLLGIAQAQRFEVDSCPPSEQSWQSCKTRAGNNLVSTGMALGVSGLTGAFITGIMFGVQKGRLRRLQDVDDRTYTLEEVELRVKRAKIGLGVSALSTVVGFGMGIAAATNTICILEPCTEPGWVAPVGITGAVVMAGGLAGMIAYGVLLRKRKRKLRRLEQAHYGTPRRVRWDLAQSRVVF